MQRCVTLSAHETIELGDLPSFLQGGGIEKPPESLSDVVTRAEREHIVNVLKITRGNRTRAAELLGISRKNLWEKMNALRITE